MYLERRIDKRIKNFGNWYAGITVKGLRRDGTWPVVSFERVPVKGL